MATAASLLREQIRGVSTILRRRRLDYVAYLVRGVAWPKIAHGVVLNGVPRAAVRSMFAAGSIAATSPAGAEQLEALGILAPRSEQDAGYSRPTTAAVEALMNRAHAANVTGVRRGFAHVVGLPDGSARFTRLSHSRHHRRRGVGYALDRDADRETFNDAFGASVLTERSARRLLHEMRAKVPRGYRDYAPIDFGGGLTIGRFVTTDSGTGRWDFFNRRIVAPIVRGRRVLDLGSNNGSLLLMMLRAGARSVRGIEFTPAIADFARLNARILCWRDVRSYDVEVSTGDMRRFLTDDLGRFDVVTAFCSLYYLAQDDMARIIRRAAGMGAALVLQANEAIDNLPARADSLRQLMTQNGYPVVTVYQEGEFGRPLLVGEGSATTRAPRD